MGITEKEKGENIDAIKGVSLQEIHFKLLEPSILRYIHVLPYSASALLFLSGNYVSLLS